MPKDTPIIDPADRIASHKAKEIFSMIRRKHEISKLDLLHQSALTVSTLTRVLEDLMASGLIEECGFGASTGGRRPILYRVRPNYGCSLGLDISRVSSRLVLLDLSGQKLASQVWDMHDKMTPDVLIKQVILQIDQWKEEHPLLQQQLLGMGIGAVGPLNRFTGRIEQPEWFQAPGWRQVDIVARFEELLHIPVRLDNGANTAIVAESFADRMKNVRHMLYVHVGIGLRSAMMSDGKLIYGAIDMEGSLGQMIIQSDGLPYRTREGNHGCLDTYCSVYAIERELRSKLRMGRSSCLSSFVKPNEEVQLKHVLAALRHQDPLTTEIITQAATYFGIGLANLLNVLHPEKVVLGGPLMTNHDLYFYTATQTAIRKTYHYPDYQVVFSKGAFGEEAIAVGAALIIIDRLSHHNPGLQG